MGLKTLISRGGYHAELGAYLRGYHPDYGPQPAAGYWDPVCTSFAGVPLSFGLFPLEKAHGDFSLFGEDSVQELMRTKPGTHQYNDDVDFARYGGLMSTILSAARVLHGGELFQGVPSKEKDTRHSSIRGTVRPIVSVDHFFSDDKLTGEQKVGTGGWGPGGAYRARPSGVFMAQTHYQSSFPINQYTVPTWNSSPSWSPRRSVQSTISDILARRHWGVGVVAGYPFYGGYLYTSLTDFSVEMTDFRVHIDYGFNTWSSNPGEMGFVVWKGEFTGTLDSIGQPYQAAPIGFSARTLEHAFSFTERWKTTCVSVSNGPRAAAWFGSVGSPGVITEVTNHMGSRSVPIVYCSTSAVGPSDFVSLDLPSIPRKLSFAGFSQSVMANERDIRASAFFSASDALDQLENGVSTNLLEQLSQLSGIVDYLPRLTQALEVVRSIHRKDLPSTIREVLDLVSELRLRYAFQYAPDFDFLTTELPRISSLLTSIRSEGSGIVVARGSFNWDFPVGEFGRPEVSLETRTKVVAKHDYDSVLAKVLGVDSLGLLPNLSNTWDLVPLSFVVDWFANVGDRLSAIDNNLLLMAMNPSYFVHSFRVRSPISSAELASAGLMFGSVPGMESVDPCFVVYIRDISSRICPPMQGKYDFLMPSRLPNWMTAGSLAWQLAT